MIDQHDLQIFGPQINGYKSFLPPGVVSRCRDTQLQAGENLNYYTLRSKGQMIRSTEHHLLCPEKCILDPLYLSDQSSSNLSTLFNIIITEM